MKGVYFWVGLITVLISVGGYYLFTKLQLQSISSSAIAQLELLKGKPTTEMATSSATTSAH